MSFMLKSIINIMSMYEEKVSFLSLLTVPKGGILIHTDTVCECVLVSEYSSSLFLYLLKVVASFLHSF